MKKLISITIFFLGVSCCFSQNLLQTATEKLGKSDWAGAATDYRKYLKKNEKDSAAWFNLAKCEMNLKEYEQSIIDFKKAKEKNFNPNFVDFQLAKIYAFGGQEDSMYKTLEAAADNGLFIFTQLKTDPAFTKFIITQRFGSILKKVELNAYPCLGNKVMRHFDFWIGEWDVFLNGQKVGENSITMAKGGCAIHESYTTQGNYAGQSINFFSPVDEKWHQHWVGSSGDVYNYVESSRTDGVLQFLSDFKNPGTGSVSISRLTFTLNDDATVQQLFETSTDGGKTWSNAFNGNYKRKK